MAHPLTHMLKLGEFRESRDIGVVWPVMVDHGKCGCGSVDLVSPVAFFVLRQDAEEWLRLENEKTLSQRTPGICSR